MQLAGWEALGLLAPGPLGWDHQQVGLGAGTQALTGGALPGLPWLSTYPTRGTDVRVRKERLTSFLFQHADL